MCASFFTYSLAVYSAPGPPHVKKQKSADPALIEDWQSVAKTLKKSKTTAPAKDSAEQLPLGGLNDDDTVSSRPQATSKPGQRRAQVCSVILAFHGINSSYSSSVSSRRPLHLHLRLRPLHRRPSRHRSRRL
jgi:hypothetical protein